MSQDEDNEKPHEPSRKKLEDARKKGEFPRSTDLSTAAAYGGLLLAAGVAGPASVEALGSRLMVLLDQSGRLSDLVFAGEPAAPAGGILRAVSLPLLPWFTVPAVAVLLVILAQRAFVVTPDKLRPRVSRLSILSNAKNKFGRNGLFEFAKSFVKLVIYSVCLTLFLRARLPEMMSALETDPRLVADLLGRLAMDLLSVVLMVALAIGGVDYMWQRQEHLRKNRMSHKDLRDESKESEGDPHLKQERRARGQQIATSRMMEDVPGADVVVVNPTHYAVALKWSRKRGEAPVCIAKGVDEVARRIRELATENGVPIHADPPTARALYASVEIGSEIAPDHYRAVAAAIRFAEAMRSKTGQPA